jgi:hypothetical protein
LLYKHTFDIISELKTNHRRNILGHPVNIIAAQKTNHCQLYKRLKIKCLDSKKLIHHPLKPAEQPPYEIQEKLSQWPEISQDSNTDRSQRPRYTITQSQTPPVTITLYVIGNVKKKNRGRAVTRAKNQIGKD